MEERDQESGHGLAGVGLGVWKLIVWTRFRAPLQQVWDVASDPSEVAACCPPGVRWEISDPEGLRRACQHGSERVFPSRWRVAGRVIDWPVKVVEAHEGQRFTLQSDTPWFEGLVHRHRFERAIGGHTRFVDELVLAPTAAPARVWVEAARALRVATHKRLARRLAADPETTGASRLYWLEEGNREHVRDPLGSLPL
jgi:hypothetical protein